MILKDKTIFIVEDNSQNRVVFQMALVRHGAIVAFERWGREVVDNLRKLPHVELIVLDLMLAHQVSGFDVFDDIRLLPAYAAVPIVAVSAMDPSEAIPQAKSKGFSGFIAKPIDRFLFPEQVAKLIAGENVWYAGERKIV